MRAPIALAFLDRYPTPTHAARLGEKRLECFLKRNRYCGRRSPTDLLERLRSAPVGHVGELENETKGQLVRSLVAALEPLVSQIRQFDGLIAAHLAEHPDAEIVQSFPHTGSINAAQILAELGDDRLRFATEDQLAGEAGVAPLTFTSGKQRGVAYRFVCSKRLRRALTTWAGQIPPRPSLGLLRLPRRTAARLRPPHAVRVLARAWVRVLWRCWHDRTPYDIHKHGRAIPFLDLTAQPASAPA